ncbi:MAG: HAD hydrolase-like protein [Betaproteobacteria bacterium]|nr:HAD hydrolase-like protein [Betaproteobacteria bacterium]
MRKPNPGMLQAAAEMLNGDLPSSLIIGDNAADLQAGKRSGLRQGFAVLTAMVPVTGRSRKRSLHLNL